MSAPTIEILDHDDLISFTFDDVEKYHGQHSIAGAALGFQVLRAAFRALYPSATPRRADVSIISGHPGNGFRDTFEMVTRAPSRGAYTVDLTRAGGRHNPLAQHAYSWEIVGVDGLRVELELRPGLIPSRFFELWRLVGQGDAAPTEWQELVRVKRGLADRVLALPLESLFLAGPVA